MDVLAQEIGWRDPESAFAHWADTPFVAWLDSAAEGDPRSRVSYLAAEPFRVILCQDGAVTVDGRRVFRDPFDVLESELARFRLPPGTAPMPFVGGAVGFLGYELARHLENLPQRHPNDLDIPEMAVALYDVVLAFDHMARRAWLLSSGFPAQVATERRTRAAVRAENVLRRLEAPAPPAAPVIPSPWHLELPRAEYEARVARVLGYIRAGDIFQANFTARHLAPRPPGLSPFAIHRALRAASPAPFAAFLRCGPRLAISSASPERFLRLEPDGRIETRPIKGTRPRGVTPVQDAKLAAELSASIKDRAENLMIVDLMRNDIGRVADIGSVAVPSLYAVEHFASVHHLVSAVTGRLRAGLGAVSLLRATFPGGSITGAPKIRAMEIIDELEVARRGPYCGTIAWIGFDGAMDSSIVIRTLTITPETIVAQAGGGIVADSNPTEEFEEMMVKVRPLLHALGGAS